MRASRFRACAVLAIPVLTAACGDPILVTGDQPAIMRVVAGVGDSAGNRFDTVATRAKLTDPAALAFDEETGILWVADRGSLIQGQGLTRRVGRVFTVTSAGQLDRLIDAGGCVASTCLESPYAMARAADGTTWITDVVGNRIVRISPGSRQFVVVGGTGVRATSPDGTPAAQATLASPAGIAIMSDGRIVFAERDANTIRVIRADGTLGTIAGTGEPAFGGDNGPAVAARLAGPTGITVHASILYIADELNHRVRAVDLETGTISTVAGNGTGGFAGDDGPALAASLGQPSYVAASPDGRTLFITDQLNHRVRTVDRVSGRIQTFAGTGASAWVPPGRPAGTTSLLRPAAVFTSHNGFLFIADGGHSVVWRTVLSF
jgi:DNA-binding beta-propeller fold protein YncE